ncbi:SDR family oxidoreductase [Mesorhizobium australicum]|uniref:NAD(P)H dehydrogenase (Quinone) n=1 Tax=Mesorhizobium australicum TaxID=536018 RepID=A0A1X7N0J1_9HYPH|nr:SDR family oxidoreductase [Mesorhizobium australicum]SMH30124.1 NAD(P)H dehydrogenase (quinone) [Mesorhizobium australicum]
MTKILVTGATGNIGRQTLKHLLKRWPTSELVGLARDPAKAADLAAHGIEVRQGDYLDYEGLVRAFEGIEKVMLVSATAFTDRNTQHQNVIDAAKQAGVQHIVFMPIIRKPDSVFILPQVTEEDLFVEGRLKASGLKYTLVRHPPFLDSVELYVGGNMLETGVHMPAGAGKAAYASRDDLAEAHAVVLSEPGHENKTYALSGDSAVSFEDIAQILSEVSGKEVLFIAVSDQDYIARLMAQGLPEPAAGFVLAWVHGVNAGEWEGKTGDLEKLLGRKPTTPAEFLRASYASLET